jgi:hypothetical protein
MSLIYTLEMIVAEEADRAEEVGYRRGHWNGYWKGICMTMIATAVINFLVSPLLGQKLLPLEATNFTQCLTVRPEQACSAYCNSPTFLR